MKKKAIILVGMSSRADWEQGILNKKMRLMQTGVVNRNFHILQTLLAREEVAQVISVDFLPFTWKKKVKEIIQAKLWMSFPQTIGRGVSWRLDTVTKKWSSLACVCVKDVKHIKKWIDPQAEIIIWSYHPFFPEVFEYFPHAKTVFDAVDDWSSHPNYQAWRSELVKKYSSINTVAGTAFTVSPQLLSLFPNHPNLHWIPNGVDLNFFSRPQNPQEFSDLPQPFAVYAGIIQERLDVALLSSVAQSLPSVHFILAGPVWENLDIQKLEAEPNVRFIGPVPYTKLPNLFSRASLGIIPHHVNRFTQSMNPLKMYEYLAAGLPVVSTPVSGTEQFSQGVRVATTPTEFSLAVTQALHQPKTKKELQELVKNESWESRVTSMLSYIPK